MKRRVFLTKGAAGVFALGAVGCSKDDSKNPLASSPGNPVISGMIADPEGNGVQGVKVTLTGSELSKSAYTDGAGKFSIEVPGNGEYTLFPGKTGYNFNPSSQKITVNNSQSFVVNIMAIIVNTKSAGITTSELGTTGIKVSNFGFGSHVSTKNTGPKREYMIREAYDRGITTFDIYNTSQGGYQYEPIGKYLSGMINDVVLSICKESLGSQTVEEKLDSDLRLFGRDYIDMYRLHAWSSTDSDLHADNWPLWEDLFKLRDNGKIRAVGIPVHEMSDLDEVFETYPDEIDYVFFPYNFYHNIGWPPELHPEFPTLAEDLRSRGIGVVTMKPFAGDYFINTLKEEAAKINPDLCFSQAALKYVLNSGLEPDTTFTGMNLFDEFLENIQAYYEPEISDDEHVLLDEVKAVAEKKAHAVLPKHYRFLDEWAPEHGNDPLIKFA